MPPPVTSADRPVLRVWRTGPQTAARNMALDEALLHATGTPPTLRLYGWTPWAVSLGRFQDPAAFRGEIPGAGMDVVRRVTGGGAIAHEDELTWALTGSTASLGADVVRSTVRIHDAVVRALGDVGVSARRLVDGPRAGGARPRDLWCFAHAGVHDIVQPDGRKLVGSAQRRVRRPAERVLVHGSIPLRRPRAPTPPRDCGCLADQVPVDAILTSRLEDALVSRFGTMLRAAPVRWEPTAGDEIETGATRLAAARETVRIPPMSGDRP